MCNGPNGPSCRGSDRCALYAPKCAAAARKPRSRRRDGRGRGLARPQAPEAPTRPLHDGQYPAERAGRQRPVPWAGVARPTSRQRIRCPRNAEGAAAAVAARGADRRPAHCRVDSPLWASLLAVRLARGPDRGLRPALAGRVVAGTICALRSGRTVPRSCICECVRHRAGEATDAAPLRARRRARHARSRSRGTPRLVVRASRRGISRSRRTRGSRHDRRAARMAGGAPSRRSARARRLLALARFARGARHRLLHRPDRPCRAAPGAG